MGLSANPDSSPNFYERVPNRQVFNVHHEKQPLKINSHFLCPFDSFPHPCLCEVRATLQCRLNDHRTYVLETHETKYQLDIPGLKVKRLSLAAGRILSAAGIHDQYRLSDNKPFIPLVFAVAESVSRLDQNINILLEAVRNTVLAMHSYDLPEIISVDIAEGNAAYLDWISESVKLPWKQ